MIVSDAPRYIVMQNIATPIRHITVAIIVAYGIRVIHDLQQLPVCERKNIEIKFVKCAPMCHKYDRRIGWNIRIIIFGIFTNKQQHNFYQKLIVGFGYWML